MTWGKKVLQAGVLHHRLFPIGEEHQREASNLPFYLPFLRQCIPHQADIKLRSYMCLSGP